VTMIATARVPGPSVVVPLKPKLPPVPPAALPSVAELFELEPRLEELRREVDEVRDTGEGSFFCSNYVWLPVNTRLRLLLGVARLPQPGDERHPELYDSRCYERIFQFLSPRLPACRGCGCRIFAGQRDAATT
jgi:hypothetical protein